MELIDEEGNLFGVINIIDALAILLVLAVVVAGIALVAPSLNSADQTASTDESGANEADGTELSSATRYATIDLGTHPNRIANQITTGDTMEQDGHNLTVTDVYVAPTDATNAAVVVRAELNGVLTETNSNTTQFEFSGNQYRIGDSLSIETNDYTVNGSIQRLDGDDPSLNTGYTTVEVTSTNLDRDIADGLEEGATHLRRGTSVITVESVATRPATIVDRGEDGTFRTQEHPTNRDVILTVELRTLETESGPRFYGGPLRLGDSLTIDTGTVTLDGRVTGLN
jgi:hypothetical protein